MFILDHVEWLTRKTRTILTESDNWLKRFKRSLQDLNNPLLYWLSSGMLIVGITGVLWALPVPFEFQEISPLLNWGSAFLMVTAIYYFIISLSLAIGLLPFLLGLAALHMWFESSGYPALAVSAELTTAGILGMAIGRRTAIRAALQDLQLVMIGPAWLLSVLYRRFGIPI